VDTAGRGYPGFMKQATAESSFALDTGYPHEENFTYFARDHSGGGTKEEHQRAEGGLHIE